MLLFFGKKYFPWAIFKENSTHNHLLIISNENKFSFIRKKSVLHVVIVIYLAGSNFEWHKGVLPVLERLYSCHKKPSSICENVYTEQY